MITKHAIVLAIILGTASGTLVMNKQHSINPASDVYGNDRYLGSDAAKFPGQSSAGPSASAPIMVAQGRCFNGHCY
jgi:hypothetical protein